MERKQKKKDEHVLFPIFPLWEGSTMMFNFRKKMAPDMQCASGPSPYQS